MYDALVESEADLADTARFRRQRLSADCTRGPVRVRGQAELSGDERFVELYADIDLPYGSLRAGHFREPLGFEAHTSSAYTSFPERAAPIEAFTPGRSDGLRLSGIAAGWSLAAGIFRGADDVDGARGDERSATARAARAFGSIEPAGTMIHAGISASVRDTGDDPVRLRARTATDLASRLADTGDLAVDDQQTTGIEAAWRSGPLAIQAESLMTWLDLQDSGTARLTGTYVQATYTLTGEGRRYARSRAAFGGIDPYAPVSEGGWGAWELALRLARTDLSDGVIAGGRQDEWMLGLNWYGSSGLRAMLAWIHADVDEADRDLLLMRIQLRL